MRYHGGKWRLASWVIEHMPPHQVYVEPFGGAGSVLLQKPRVRGEVYNDLDGEVVNVFRILQHPRKCHRLRRRLYMTPFSRREFEKAYRPSTDPVERAARMIIRSFMGFGSDTATRDHVTGFRMAVSRDGFMGQRRKDQGGQTPAIDWSTWPEAMPAFAERLRGVIIENRPALQVIDTCDYPDALHYLDPPYVHSTRKRVGKGRGYRFEMTDQDHEELAERAHRLCGMVMVSGYHSPLYDFLYGDWHRVERHHVAQEARKTVEVLWMNPAAADAQRQTLFNLDLTA
jgi:DNA adenine methylase